MTKEYDMLAQTFGWGDEDFDELNKTAIEAAFCDAATRDIIIKRLETAQ